MLTPKDVAQLVDDLKVAKVLNTEATLEQMVKAIAKSPNLTPAVAGAADGDATVAWYVAGGSGYVLVVPS